MLVFSLIVIIIILSKRVIVIIITLIKPGEMACLRFVCLFVFCLLLSICCQCSTAIIIINNIIIIRSNLGRWRVSGLLDKSGSKERGEDTLLDRSLLSVVIVVMILILSVMMVIVILIVVMIFMIKMMIVAILMIS